MAWSRHNEDETDSTADADTDSLFDSSDDDETDITSNSDTDSPSEIDDDTDDDASLFDDEVQHPPEHYLTAAASLDVQRLRQQRFSDKTRDRLDVVKEHCIQ
jgi:hypothetical protein